MDMVHGDGQPQALDLLRSANRFDLIHEKRRQDRAKKLAVELGSPHEVVVKLVVRMPAQIVARYLVGVFDQTGGGERWTHGKFPRFQVGLTPEVGGCARLNHGLTTVVTWLAGGPLWLPNRVVRRMCVSPCCR